MFDFARGITHITKVSSARGALIALCLALFACASTPSRYQTVADATLQRDVMQSIGAREMATGGSRRPVLVSVRPAEHSAEHGHIRTELWVVDSNGRRTTYRVSFTPERGAGTTYSITRIEPPHP